MIQNDEAILQHFVEEWEREDQIGLAHLNPADEPVFNVPFLSKNHLRAGQDHELIAIPPRGQRVYASHP